MCSSILVQGSRAFCILMYPGLRLARRVLVADSIPNARHSGLKRVRMCYYGTSSMGEVVTVRLCSVRSASRAVNWRPWLHISCRLFTLPLPGSLKPTETMAYSGTALDGQDLHSPRSPRRSIAWLIECFVALKAPRGAKEASASHWRARWKLEQFACSWSDMIGGTRTGDSSGKWR